MERLLGGADGASGANADLITELPESIDHLVVELSVGRVVMIRSKVDSLGDEQLGSTRQQGCVGTVQLHRHALLDHILDDLPDALLLPAAADRDQFGWCGLE